MSINFEIADVIAVNPAYNKITGNMAKTVLLSHLVYWNAKRSLKKWGETWIVRTSAELCTELCVESTDVMSRHLRQLKKLGVIRSKISFFNGKRAYWIQVCSDKLDELLGVSKVTKSQLPDETKPTKSQFSEDSKVTKSQLPDETKPTKSQFSGVEDGQKVKNISEITLPETTKKPEITKSSKMGSASPSETHDDDIEKLLKDLPVERRAALTQRVCENWAGKKSRGEKRTNFDAYLKTAIINEKKSLKRMFRANRTVFRIILLASGKILSALILR